MKIIRANVKRCYYKVHAQDEDNEWYVIAPTADEASSLADRIGMPKDRGLIRVWLTDEQYESIPEVG